MPHAVRLLLILTLVALVGPSARAKEAELEDKALARRIEQAIEKGRVALTRAQGRDGAWAYDGTAGRPQLPGAKRRVLPHGSAGLTGLAMYALAAAGGAPEALKRGAAWAQEHPALFGEASPWATYATAFLVLAQSTRTVGGAEAARHAADVARLVASQLPSGMWSYGPRAQGLEAQGDHSNTQVAVFALWTAVHETDAKVPKEAWQRTRDHFAQTQLADGSWGYRPAAGKRATGKATKGTWVMTAAGLTSYLYAAAALRGGMKALPRLRKDKVVVKARAALAALGRPDLADPYQLWLAERVGTALALPLADWYVELARQLVKSQARDGTWPAKERGGYGDRRAAYGTALRLLFLTRATRAVVTR